MSLLVHVDGRRIRVTRHAIERYQERVRPTLTVQGATAELRRVLPFATLGPAPDWARRYRTATMLHLADGIMFVIVNGYATTCLTRSMYGDEMRAARTAAKPRRWRPEENRAA